MPTYEYRCKSCGHSLEVVQSFTDDALTKCPACKKKQLRKVFGSIGITFKGSGFYKTDSRSGSSAAAASTSSSDGDTRTDTTSGDKKTGEPKTEKSEKKAEKSEKKTDTAASSTTPAA